MEADPEMPLAHAGKKGIEYGAAEGKNVHAHVGIPVVCWYILVVELCERLCFYTLAGSQAFFLEHIGFSLSSAGSLNATMWTLCTVLAIFASWMADVGLGRYSTILVSGIIYVLGTAIASLAAVPGRESSNMYFLGVMGFLPIATAGIKANISNFGADQYEGNGASVEAARQQFFSIFYCSINVGAAMAYGFFTTFASSGGLGVPQRWGYAAAYGAMAVCMVLAVLIFRSGRSSYKVQPVQERSALASLLSALHNRTLEGSYQAASVQAGLMLLVAAIAMSAAKAMISTAGSSLMAMAFACAGVGTIAVVFPCLDAKWLRPRSRAMTQDEKDVEVFLSLLPPLFLGSLAFNAVYNCMQFWYQQQACQMDVRLPWGSGDFQLSGSFFNIADCIGIVIMTPLAVMWIDPALHRLSRGRFGHGAKFSLGMIVAAMSVMVAARLEITRKSVPVLSVTSNCAPPGVDMSAISGAWMMVPFFLMGVAEIYTQPTLLHYAYSKSPPSMRSLAMAASFFIAAVSSALFALLVNAMSPYMPNDLNEGHLEYGYFINILVGMVLLVPFLSVLKE